MSSAEPALLKTAGRDNSDSLAGNREDNSSSKQLRFYLNTAEPICTVTVGDEQIGNDNDCDLIRYMVDICLQSRAPSVQDLTTTKTTMSGPQSQLYHSSPPGLFDSWIISTVSQRRWWFWYLRATIVKESNITKIASRSIRFY